MGDLTLNQIRSFPPSGRWRVSRGLIGATSTGLAALFLSGCVTSSRYQVEVGLDTSWSMSDARRRGAISAFEAALGTLGFETPVAAWMFDTAAAKCHEAPLATENDLLLFEQKYRATKAPGEGTHLAPVLRAMLPMCQQADAAGHTTVVFLCSDGGNRDHYDTTSEVKKLAACRSLRAVWVIGIADTQRTTVWNDIDRQFAALGDRLITSGASDPSSGLAKFQALLRKEHRP